MNADIIGLRARCENRRKLGIFDAESDGDGEELATLTVPLLMLERVLASAPAPASGRVDAVAVKPVVWEKYWGGSNDDIPSWRASTPVGLTLNVDFAGERLEKHSDADPARLAAKQADAFAWYEQSIRSALSPAATPVSETKGD